MLSTNSAAIAAAGRCAFELSGYTASVGSALGGCCFNLALRVPRPFPLQVGIMNLGGGFFWMDLEASV